MRYKYSENLTEASEMTFAENEYQGIEQNGTMKRIPTTKVKQGVQDALRDDIDNAVSLIEEDIADLAGSGRTTETVKKNADDILAMKGVGYSEQTLVGIDRRIDNIIEGQDLDPNKDSELVDARLSGNTGVLYTLLKNRLDAMERKMVVTNEIDIPIATIKFRMSGSQPQLVTEAL